MRVFLTGVSGFSGSHLARALANNGHSVAALYRRETPFLDRARSCPRVTLVRGDLCSPIPVSGPFDAVVHCGATSPAPGISVHQIVRDNVEATARLLETAKAWGIRAFVYFSSVSVYGDVVGPVLSEQSPVINPEVYGASKLIGEQMLADCSGHFGSLTLRLPGVVGTGAHRNWLSRVMAALVAGRPVRAFHLDQPYNNAAHVDDIAALVQRALTRISGTTDVIVLGAAGVLTARDVIHRLARGLETEATIEEIVAPKANFILSSERAIQRWGYAPMEIGELLDRYAREVKEFDEVPT